MRVYVNGRLAGTWVRDGADFDFIPLISGAETGGGYVAAAIGHEETKEANKDIRDATVAGQAAARAELEKQYAISQGWLSGQDERNAADVNAQNAFLTDTYTGQNAENTGIMRDQNAVNTGLATGQNAMNRADLAQWGDTGAAANREMADLQGLNGPEAQQAAYERFKFDPDYRMRVQQGEQSILRNRSAMGGLASGNTGVALADYNRGMAGDAFTNAFNRLMNLSTSGQQARTNVASLNTGNTQAFAGLNNQNVNNAMSLNNANVNNMATLRNNNTIGQVDRGNANNAFRIGMGNEYAANMANIQTGIAGANANYFNQQNQNTVNTLNNAANYTDTMSVNAYNRGANLASTAGKAYAGGA